MLHCLRARLSPAKSKNQSFKIGHTCTFVLAFSTAHDVVATSTCSAHGVTACTSFRFERLLVHVHPKLPPPRAFASDTRREVTVSEQASLHSPNPCRIEIGSPALRGDMLWRPRQLVVCCLSSEACLSLLRHTVSHNRSMMSTRQRFEKFKKNVTA